MPRAGPGLCVNCAATAATAAKTQPADAADSPRAMEPAAGRPRLMSPPAMRVAITRLAPATTISAAVSGANRPTTAEPTSSRRPDSSSVRVCLITKRMLTGAIRMALFSPVRHATSPPRVGLYTSPSIATAAGVFILSSAYALSASAVG